MERMDDLLRTLSTIFDFDVSFVQGYRYPRLLNRGYGAGFDGLRPGEAGDGALHLSREDLCNCNADGGQGLATLHQVER